MSNVKYELLMRDLFEYMSVVLTDRESTERYMIKILNEKIEKALYETRMNCYKVEELIQDIARCLFEKGKCTISLIITHIENSNDIDKLFLTIKEVDEKILHENEKIYTFKVKNSRKVISNFKRKILLYRINKLDDFKVLDYNSQNSIKYALEKNTKNKYKFRKYTKDIYIENDMPEDITTYYFVHRLIRTRIFQIKMIKYIVEELNKNLEKALKQKNIIEYVGLEIESIYKYKERLENFNGSIVEISNDVMKAKKI